MKATLEIVKVNVSDVVTASSTSSQCDNQGKTTSFTD